MFGWIKRAFLKKEIKKLSTESTYEKFLDKLLKESSQEYAQSLRENQKLQKVYEAKRRVRELNEATEKARRSIIEDEEDECPHGVPESGYCPKCDADDSEPDYDPHDPEQIMMKVLADKIAGKSAPSLSSTTAGLASPAKGKLQQMLNGMSDEQAEAFIRNYGL